MNIEVNTIGDGTVLEKDSQIVATDIDHVANIECCPESTVKVVSLEGQWAGETTTPVKH